MNVIFLLTPKKNVLFLTIDMSVSMALDQLKNVRYSSVPLLDTDGHFIGTITEGDLLWHLENSPNHDQALTKQLKTLKRAILVSADKDWKNASFFETVAVNRGQNVKVFAEKNKPSNGFCQMTKIIN